MPAYIGRFAPSPTGPLHFGSLVAALASYIDAAKHGGQWLLRIDDADLSRVQAGADQAIQDQLKHYGFVWHGQVSYTQQFRQGHQRALDTLVSQHLCYGCQCTRAQLISSQASDIGEKIYPQLCTHLEPALSADDQNTRALRLKVPQHPIRFEDRLLGLHTQNVAQSVGDFVLWRPAHVTHVAGGLFNYQLTIVHDDHAQGITHIVRGADLLHNTARQCLLYDMLDYARPQYAHVPLVLMQNGAKLSKQHGAQALPQTDVVPTLNKALVHLGYPPSTALNVHGFWRDVARFKSSST